MLVAAASAECSEFTNVASPPLPTAVSPLRRSGSANLSATDGALAALPDVCLAGASVSESTSDRVLVLRRLSRLAMLEEWLVWLMLLACVAVLAGGPVSSCAAVAEA